MISRFYFIIIKIRSLLQCIFTELNVELLRMYFDFDKTASKLFVGIYLLLRYFTAHSIKIGPYVFLTNHGKFPNSVIFRDE